MPTHEKVIHTSGFILISTSIIFVLYLIISFSGNAKSNKSDYTLQSVSVVFRHGDRTPDPYPIESYANDPYLNESFLPIGRGGLTNAGKKRMYELGTRLRIRYSDFLSKAYRPSEISAISTPTERTKMSLQLVLASLYAPADKQTWNENLHWQPIPIDTFAKGLPSYLYFDLCPTYIRELERVKNLSEYKKELSNFDELAKNLTILTGDDMSDLYAIFSLYFTLATESSMKLTLPPWTKPYFPKGPINDAALFEYKTMSYTNSIKRVNGGLFVRKVLNDNIYEKKDASTKLFLYSAHDHNIGGILHALNLWNYKVPPYSSGVILEFYKNKNGHFIRTLRYKGIPSEIESQVIPGCTEYCALKDFLRIMGDVLPADTINACLGPPDDSLFVPKSNNTVAWIYTQIKQWFNI